MSGVDQGEVIALIKAVGGGGGGSGTDNYNDLDNKPKINNVTLSGSKSLDDLGINAGIAYDDSETYSAGSVGAELGNLKSEITANENLYILGTDTVSPVWLNKTIDSGGNITIDASNRLVSEEILIPPNARLTVSRLSASGNIEVYVYDKDHTFISASQVLLDAPYRQENNLIKFLRIRAMKTDNSDITPEEGDTYASAVFEYTKAVHAGAGKNLIDTSKSVNGHYLGTNTGAYSDSATYDTTDFLPISAGQSIVFNKHIRKFLAYDAKMLPIAATYQSNEQAAGYYFTATVDGYVRASYWHSDASAIMAEYGTVPTDYVAYRKTVEEGIHLSETMISDVVSTEDNILAGKKWVPCGDSFSAYTNATFDSGEYSGKDKVYSRLIAERNGMILNDGFMLSGRTLAYPSDGTFDNSLTASGKSYYYQNIPADADYITIMLGVNDSHHASEETGTIPIGTISDATTATYYGAWNVVLSWLIENRPFAHIGILVSNGCETADYRTAQIAIAKKHGVPYLDLNGDSRTPAMIRSQNTDIDSTIRTLITQKQAVDYDGTETGEVNTHPNYKAHAYESTFIEAFLRSI